MFFVVPSDNRKSLLVDDTDALYKYTSGHTLQVYQHKATGVPLAMVGRHLLEGKDSALQNPVYKAKYNHAVTEFLLKECGAVGTVVGDVILAGATSQGTAKGLPSQVVEAFKSYLQ